LKVSHIALISSGEEEAREAEAAVRRAAVTAVLNIFEIFSLRSK
jgi:ribosomal protein S5